MCAFQRRMKGSTVTMDHPLPGFRGDPKAKGTRASSWRGESLIHGLSGICKTPGVDSWYRRGVQGVGTIALWFKGKAGFLIQKSRKVEDFKGAWEGILVLA